jgi:RNA polymerase sigma-70 factor (ECF subfamily)
MIYFGKSEKDFQEFYRTHGIRVRRTLQGMVGNHATAEELTQEAFLKAWKNLASFGFKSSLSTWIYQIAINTALDWLRSHKAKWIQAEVESSSESELTPEKRAVTEALMELDEDNRALIVLHYYEGLSLKEIGAILKIPEGTVKSRLHQAKALLKPRLLNRGFDV